MRHLLILSCLLFGTGAVADEADFDFKSLGAKKALRDYKATLAKEDKAKQKAMEEMEAEAKKAQKTNRVELIMNLEQALKKALQDADLEEANKIDAAIKTIQAEQPLQLKTSGKNVTNSKKTNARFKIPAAAKRFQRHSYLAVHIHNITWEDARDLCKEMGGYLAVINSPQEFNFLYSLVGPAPPDRNLWIGAAKVKGNWQWGDGRAIESGYWVNKKPSLKPGSNYAYINSVGSIWNARSPHHNIPGFICEWNK